MPTVWYTLTFADHHWQDFFKLFYDDPASVPNAERHRCLDENEHMANAFFVRRCERFLGHLFSVDAWKTVWTWWRDEWQSRGAIHLHGLCRLFNDPGLVQLSELFAKGVQAGRRLRAHLLLQQYNVSMDDVQYKRDRFKKVVSLMELGDKAIGHQFIYSAETLLDVAAQNPLDAHAIDTLEMAEAIGDGAGEKIINYHDYLLTAMNPSNPLPSDAEASVRAARAAASAQAGPHPASVCHDPGNGEVGLRPDLYPALVNHCNRHRCSGDGLLCSLQREQNERPEGGKGRGPQGGEKAAKEEEAQCLQLWIVPQCGL
jgi:hypothetical protein